MFSKSNATPQFRQPQVDPNLVTSYPDVGSSLDNLFNQYARIKQNQRAEDTIKQTKINTENAQRLDRGFTDAEATPARQAAADSLITQATPQGPMLPANAGQVIQQPGVDHLVTAIAQYKQKKSSTESQGSRFKESEIQKNLGTATDSHYDYDQAAFLTTPPDKPEQLAANRASIQKLFPGGKVPKDFTHIAATNNRVELTTGLRQDQQDQKQWDEINRRTNPNVAPRGSLLGTAGTVNARADRALQTLNSSTITNQDLKGVAADIAGILKGGTPDQQAEKSQSYGTLYSDLTNAEQYITGSPKDAAPKEIVAHLKDRIKALKEVDNKILADNLQAAETVFKPTIGRDTQRWEQHKKNIMATTSGVQPSGSAADYIKSLGLSK